MGTPNLTYYATSSSTYTQISKLPISWSSTPSKAIDQGKP